MSDGKPPDMIHFDINTDHNFDIEMTENMSENFIGDLREGSRGPCRIQGD